MMASGVNFKIYFEDEGEPQIRKLVLSEKPTFSGLEGQILTLLSNHNERGLNRDIRIQYLDQEVDRVSIGSDEELNHFFREQSCADCLKIYVQTIAQVRTNL